MFDRYIECVKTNRYYLQGNEKNPARLVFVLHGYGQLARFFMRKFQVLFDDHTLVVAPEGMHRFYLSESAGRVGASWMTVEDRLNDIKDYVRYLDALASEIMGTMNKKPELIVLGFSQGGATACRWASMGQSRIESLILWGAPFPPDLNMDEHAVALRRLRIELVVGTEDEVVRSEGFVQAPALLDQYGIAYSITQYKGGHEIVPAVLSDLMR